MADTTFIDAFHKHNAIKLLIDPVSGEIVEANGSSEEFYGYPSLTSMKIQQINQLSAEQVAAERKLAATEGRNFFVFRHKLADGTIKTVEVHSSPIEYQGRKLLFSIIKDISPERNMAAELWHYQTRLEKLVEDQTESIQKKSDTINLLMGLALIILLAIIGLMTRLFWLKKHSEKELLESKMLYDLAVEGTGVGIWSWKAVSNEAYWSEQFFTLLGFKNNEIEPSFKEWKNRLHPDDREPTIAALEAHFNEGSDFQVEFRLREKSGAYRWFRVMGHSLKDKDNNPTEMAGSLQDIHQRKLRDLALEAATLNLTSEVTLRSQAEKLSKMQRDRLQVILEQASDGIHILNRYGDVVECSHAFGHMLGYSREEALQLNVRDWEGQMPDDQVEDVINDLIQMPKTFETLHRKKNGTTYPAEVTTKVVSIDEEVFLYASVRDITERKKSEQAIKDANQKLEAIVNSANVAIAWASERGKIEYVNPAFTKIFGWKLEEIPTIRDWFAKAYQDIEYRNEVLAAWQNRVERSKSNHEIIESMEVNVNCKDGTQKYMLLNGAWAGDLLVATFSDISEQKSEKQRWKTQHCTTF